MAVAVLPSVSHRVHIKTARALPLGHVHQLIVAALGHRSLAAYQSATNEARTVADFAGVAHIVLDVDGLQQRQVELATAASTNAPLLEAIVAALRAVVPHVAVHQSLDDLADAIYGDVEGTIDSSDEFASEQALTNAVTDSYDLTFSAPEPLTTRNANAWVLEVDGLCSLAQDPDRPYSGTEIDVRARVVFTKLGQRLLAAPEIEDVGAALRSDHDSDGFDEPDDPADAEPPEDLSAANLPSGGF